MGSLGQLARAMESEREWSGLDLNPRLPSCKPGALTAELPPLIGYKDSKRTRGVLRSSRYYGDKRDRSPEATRYRHRRYHSRPGAWGDCWRVQPDEHSR